MSPKSRRILERLAVGPDAASAGAAIGQLDAVLAMPYGTFGREPGAEELDIWRREAEEVLDRMVRIGIDPGALPVARYAVRRQLLEWHSRHWPELAPARRRAVRAVPPLPEESLWDALCGIALYRHRIGQDRADAAQGALASTVDHLAELQEAPEGNGRERFQPLPHSLERAVLPGLAGDPGFADLLRTLRGRLVRPSRVYRDWIPKLFRMASPEWDVAEGVIGEWALGKDPEQVDAAVYLLRECGHGVVFEREALVAAILANAQALSQECYEQVTSTLFGIVISGTFGGSPSEPPPRLVHDRDRAAECARRQAGNPAARAFYEAIQRYAERDIARHLREWDEEAR